MLPFQKVNIVVMYAAALIAAILFYVNLPIAGIISYVAVATVVKHYDNIFIEKMLMEWENV